MHDSEKMRELEYQALAEITKELGRAKREHPGFAESIHEAYTVISAEHGEIGDAILKDPDNIVSEMAQCAATCIRGICFVLGQQEAGHE